MSKLLSIVRTTKEHQGYYFSTLCKYERNRQPRSDKVIRRAPAIGYHSVHFSLLGDSTGPTTTIPYLNPISHHQQSANLNHFIMSTSNSALAIASDDADAVTVRSFEVSEELACLNISKEQYLREHKELEFLAAGCLVFHGDRLLLVQRAVKEKTFRNRWEIPGGKCDDEDETILHSAARELLEEAGLHVARFNYQVGQNTRFQTGPPAKPRFWQKFSFVVDVEEAGPDPKKQRMFDVKLNPVEHQRFLWVTQEEVKKSRSQDTELRFTSYAQKELMLEAFKRRKADKRGEEKALKPTKKPRTKPQTQIMAIEGRVDGEQSVAAEQIEVQTERRSRFEPQDFKQTYPSLETKLSVRRVLQPQPHFSRDFSR
jgi:8-oxo-dGTP pyrophosphatase MutT (NUDIX family)